MFEKAVEMNGEPAHEGGEGDFMGFALCTKALVKGLENGIVP